MDTDSQMIINKSFLQRILFFTATRIAGFEILRVYWNKFTLSLLEEGSHLAEYTDYTYEFDLYHVLTNYLPLLTFGVVLLWMTRQGKALSGKQMFIPGIAAMISSFIPMILFLFPRYFEVCLSWYFTAQLGLVLTYYFATLFAIGEVAINARLKYFFIALFFATFFDQAMQCVISLFTSIGFYIPYGKNDGIIWSVYIVMAGVYRVLHQRKVLN